MLAGSTPTSTGRPWKKISSRQPTRTNARHRASRAFRTRPAAKAAALIQRCSVERPGQAVLAQDQGEQDEDLVEAQPHRRGGDGELALLVRGELDGLGEPVPELGILVTEVLILLDQVGPVGPPSCASSTAAWTFWA